MKNSFWMDDILPNVNYSEQIGLFVESSDGVVVLYINTRSVVHRWTLFQATLSSLPFKPDVIVMVATWLFEDETNFYNLNGYKAFHACRPRVTGRGRGDGTSVYVIDSGKIEPIHLESICIQYSTIVIVKLSNLNQNIMAVYRPEQTNINVFLFEFDRLLKKYPRTICVGDFNINLLDVNNRQVVEYMDVLNGCGFVTLNSRDPRYATRKSNTINTTIDHVSTDILNSDYSLSIVPTSLSDHQMIVCKFTCVNRPRSTTGNIQKTVLNHNALQSDGRWLDVENCNSLEALIDVVKNMISDHTVTVTSAKRRTNCAPWITVDIIRSIKLREKLFNYKKRFPNNTYIVNFYNCTCLLVKRMINNAKKDYYDSRIATNVSDSRSLWKNIKEIIYNKPADLSRDISSLNINGTRVVDALTMSNHMNEYFINTPLEIVRNLGIAEDEYFVGFSYEVNNPVELQPINVNVIEDGVASLRLNVSTGVDGISAKFLKRYVSRLSNPLTRIMNGIIETGEYPDCLKEAIVVPIHKSGPVDDCSNYRPISILSSINMIFEGIIRNWFERVLSENNIINQYQFGFLKQSNTLAATTNLNYFLSRALDMGLFTAILNLDIKRAFDCISHRILIRKLKKLGLTRKEIKLLISYLTNRSQRVRIRDVKGNKLFSRLGVPQGSKLGPYLFNFFINDIFKLNLHGQLQLYADDAIIKYACGTLAELFEQMRSDLLVLNEWFSRNGLLLNLDKSNFIIFYRNWVREAEIGNFNFNLTINGTTLKRVRTSKYLGLIIDERFGWNEHVDKIRTEISPYVFMLYRCRYFMSERTAKMIYFAYILSRLAYLTPAWMGAPGTKINELRVLQHRALKIIYRLPLLTHSDVLFSENILSIDNIIKYELLLLIYRVTNNLIRHSFNLTLVSDVHSYPTRQRSHYYIEPTATAAANFNAIVCGLSLFNALPLDLKNVTNIGDFKYHLKRFLSD